MKRKLAPLLLPLLLSSCYSEEMILGTVPYSVAKSIESRLFEFGIIGIQCQVMNKAVSICTAQDKSGYESSFLIPNEVKIDVWGSMSVSKAVMNQFDPETFALFIIEEHQKDQPTCENKEKWTPGHNPLETKNG